MGLTSALSGTGAGLMGAIAAGNGLFADDENKGRSDYIGMAAGGLGALAGLTGAIGTVRNHQEKHRWRAWDFMNNLGGIAGGGVGILGGLAGINGDQETAGKLTMLGGLINGVLGLSRFGKGLADRHRNKKAAAKRILGADGHARATNGRAASLDNPADWEALTGRGEDLIRQKAQADYGGTSKWKLRKARRALIKENLKKGGDGSGAQKAAWKKEATTRRMGTGLNIFGTATGLLSAASMIGAGAGRAGILKGDTPKTDENGNVLTDPEGNVIYEDHDLVKLAGYGGFAGAIGGTVTGALGSIMAGKFRTPANASTGESKLDAYKRRRQNQRNTETANQQEGGAKRSVAELVDEDDDD